MPRDQQKLKLWKRRDRDRRMAAKYGPEAIGVDMRGRHGKHSSGSKNARWRGGRFVTSGGYVAVRVAPDHPHAWGADPRLKYAYEHILIAEKALGRCLSTDEVVHHRDGDRQNNDPGNLEVLQKTEHARHHATERGRNAKGQFPPAARCPCGRVATARCASCRRPLCPRHHTFRPAADGGSVRLATACLPVCDAAFWQAPRVPEWEPGRGRACLSGW